MCDTVTDDGSSISVEKRSGCIDGHEVWLYTLVGGKHDWPGSWGNRDVNASEEIWKFLERFVDSDSAD